MTYGVFSKFEKSHNQIFIYGEVIKEFQWQIRRLEINDVTENLSESARKTHENMVGSAVERIKNSPLQKVVLSRRQSLKRKHTDLEILENLLDLYPKANCYFFHQPSVGTWMGATPETLLSYKNGNLKTMSLAGTQTAENQSEIKWEIKELEEQKLVTDFIVKALKSASTDDVQTGEIETIKAGELYHLQTLISAQTHFQNLGNCVNHLHPTPAVCGLPREMALEYILEHEDYDRSFYTGYLGISDPVDEVADYYVNLRCMELKEDVIDLYAGGGITALSDPTAEFREVQNKLMTMASIL